MRVIAIVFASLIFVACSKTEQSPAVDTGAAPSATPAGTSTSTTSSNAMTFKITSSAFQPNGSIPSKYTCEGEDTSPPLEWSDLPPSAKSVALIVDDPDAPDPAKPKMTYVHWVVYNIPTSVTKFEENAAKTGLPGGAMKGTNDWKKQTYGGPCPPIGRHRYFFKLYALDAALSGLNNPTKADLEKAMQGHIIAQTEIVATYQKRKA